MVIKDLKKSFGDRTLFQHVDLEVVGGERIALLGDNGTGKSTLIKMIMGEERPDEGKIRLGPTVKIGYLPQIIHFDRPDRNLVDTMLYAQNCSTQEARDRLAAFDFRGRMCSRASPPSPAESSPVCGCACSWTTRSTF